MKPLPFNQIKDFEAAEIEVVNNKIITGLFTNLRIDRDTLPEGCYAYDIREGDNDVFSTVELFVGVNHTGAFVTREEIPMLIKDGHDEYSNIISFGIECEEPSDDDWRKQYLKD